MLPFPCDVLCKMSLIYTSSPSRAPSLDILMSGFSSSSAAAWGVQMREYYPNGNGAGVPVPSSRLAPEA